MGDPVQTFTGLGVVGALLALTLRLMIRNDTATWRLMGDARSERDRCEAELDKLRERLSLLEAECAALKALLRGHEGDGR